MLKKIIILFAIVLLGQASMNAQSDRIHIKKDQLTEVNYLETDDFYLTHHLYIDLFLRENLLLDASQDEVSSILKALKKFVSTKNRLTIEIDKPGQDNYLIRLVVFKKDDGTELLIAFTNWDSKTKSFEKEIKIENDSYTRWYFLNGNKMTYRKDMSDQNDYSQLTDIELAGAYLFDELPNNDDKIKTKIKEILKLSDLNAYEEINANLILLKYQLFKRDFDNLPNQTMVLNNLFDKYSDDISLKGLEAAFRATKFQIDLMK